MKHLEGGHKILPLSLFFAYLYPKQTGIRLIHKLFFWIIEITLIFFLLYFTGGVKAGCSGDCYSGSGDWTINNPTTVDNETYTINGSIYINNDLTLDNCTINFNSTSHDQYNISGTSGNFTFKSSNFTDMNSKRVDFLNLTNTTTIWNCFFVYFNDVIIHDANMTITQSTFSRIVNLLNFYNLRTTIIENNTFQDGEGVKFGHVGYDVLTYPLSFQHNTITNATTYGMYMCNLHQAGTNTYFAHNIASGGTYGLLSSTTLSMHLDNCSFSGGTYDLYMEQSHDTNLSHCIAGGGDGTIHISESTMTILYNTYFSTTTIANSTYQLWWLVNMTFKDLDYAPLSGAIIDLYTVLGGHVWEKTTGATGRISSYIMEEENGTNYNDFTLIISYGGDVASRTLTVHWEKNVTYVMDEFRILKTNIHINFYNAFTGFGEDPYLLKIYYSVNGGALTRTSDNFFLEYSTGMSVKVQVKDYFDFLVNETTISPTDEDYYLDFAIPLVTLKINNLYNITGLNLTRGDKTITVMGNEIKVIADWEGKSTIEYKISWKNETQTLENGSTRKIVKGEYRFTAEATTGRTHILANINTKIKPKYETVETPEAEEAWYESKEFRALAGVLAVVAGIFWFWRLTLWIGKKRRAKA